MIYLATSRMIHVRTRVRTTNSCSGTSNVALFLVSSTKYLFYFRDLLPNRWVIIDESDFFRVKTDWWNA